MIKLGTWASHGLASSFSTSSNFEVAHGATPTIGVAVLTTSDEIASLDEYHEFPHFKHSSCTESTDLDGKVIITETSIQFEMVNPGSTGPAPISSYDTLDPS